MGFTPTFFIFFFRILALTLWVGLRELRLQLSFFP
jgi:hypothetical protein